MPQTFPGLCGAAKLTQAAILLAQGSYSNKGFYGLDKPQVQQAEIPEKGKANYSGLWSFWRKTVGLCTPTLRYKNSGDKKVTEGEVGRPRRWSKRELSAPPT